MTAAANSAATIRRRIFSPDLVLPNSEAHHLNYARLLSHRPADGVRVKQRTLLESQAVIDFDGARVVGANGKKWALTASVNAVHQGTHDGRRIAAAFMAGHGGHGSDLAIAGDMQAQPAHRHQFAFFTDA